MDGNTYGFTSYVGVTTALITNVNISVQPLTITLPKECTLKIWTMLFSII